MPKIDGLKLDGIIEMADGETVDGLFDAFTDFLEARKCYFWGSHQGVDTDKDDDELTPQLSEPLNPELESAIRERLRRLNEDDSEITRPAVVAMFRGQTRLYVQVQFKKGEDGIWYCATYNLLQADR